MQSRIENNDRVRRIIKSFSKHTRSYDKHAHLQKAMAERLAALLPEHLPERVLEIGCGTGIFTRHLLARNVKHLILNDIAPAMIDHLKTQIRIPGKTQFLPGNAETIDFPKTGLIVANAVFQWFNDPERALARMAQSLKTGGDLVFSVFGPKTLAEFRIAGKLQSPATLLSRTLWKNLLVRCGFTNLVAESETRNIFFPNTLSMIKSLQLIGAAPLPQLNSSALKKLIRDYDRAFATPQGVYSRWELLYFRGHKGKV
jgi:malonyl-ACP O-methyltransferase BioC